MQYCHWKTLTVLVGMCYWCVSMQIRIEMTGGFSSSRRSPQTEYSRPFSADRRGRDSQEHLVLFWVGGVSRTEHGLQGQGPPTPCPISCSICKAVCLWLITRASVFSTVKWGSVFLALPRPSQVSLAEEPRNHWHRGTGVVACGHLSSCILTGLVPTVLCDSFSDVLANYRL